MRGLLTSLWYVLTLRCEEADRIRSVARHEDLSRAERFGSWAHAAVCRSCWAARKQAEKLEALVDELHDERPAIAGSTGQVLSQERRARIAQALNEESDRLEN